MSAHQAPGLPGNWLNGWLAAVGITVLLDNVHLSWTDDVVPIAVFHGEDDLAGALAAVLPSDTDLGRLAIARHHPNTPVELPRDVTFDAFAARARLARSSHDLTLEATLTDLARKEPSKNRRKDEGEDLVAHGPLDPDTPRGRTLHERLMAVRSAITDPAVTIERSLAGHGVRIKGNGLGFDHRRFAAGVQPDAEVAVDPVIELLCFFSLLLLPVRGAGAHTRRYVRQRGWDGSRLRRHALTWPIWAMPLDRWGIDALLDIVWTSSLQTARRWGVSGLYGSVAQQPKSSSDVSRSYASERLW